VVRARTPSREAGLGVHPPEWVFGPLVVVGNLDTHVNGATTGLVAARSRLTVFRRRRMPTNSTRRARVVALQTGLANRTKRNIAQLARGSKSAQALALVPCRGCCAPQISRGRTRLDGDQRTSETRELRVRSTARSE
jgi:hypothetical protein